KWNLQLPASSFQCSGCHKEFSLQRYGRNMMIWSINGSSPSLRLEFGLDNKGLRAVVDKRRIPRNILENKSPRRRNHAHGCLWYRSLARSARIARDRSGHTPTTAGFASRTTGDLPRVSALPD